MVIIDYFDILIYNFDFKLTFNQTREMMDTIKEQNTHMANTFLNAQESKDVTALNELFIDNATMIIHCP